MSIVNSALAYLFITLVLVGCNSSTQLRRYRPAEEYMYTQRVEINYEVHGHGETPVIMLHGFGASLNSWDDIRPLFSEDEFKLYLLDLKGFGFSSKIQDDDYSIVSQAGIVHQFLIDNGLRHVILIGHSYGGGTALLTYLQSQDERTDLISEMVLIDCASYLEELPFFMNYLRNPFSRFFMFNFTTSRYRAEYTLKRLFYDTDRISEERIERYARFFGEPGAKYTFAKAAEQIIPQNYDELTARYHEITVPTLIIWGKQDPIFSLNIADSLHRAIKGSKLVVIDNCGHIPHEERPEQTFNEIVKFIGR